MKYKVIFDTNIIRSEESIDNFFGGHLELPKFLKMSEIIMPEMVIDEIKAQKRIYLNTEKEKFIKNSFYSLMGIKEKTENFSIDKFVSDLYKTKGMRIPHEVIYLTRETALEDIKNLCLKKQPPFSGADDKGFKDAHIYFTILDYLKKISDEKVYFVTEDKGLIKSFEDEPRVIVVNDHGEFMNDSGVFLYDYYFTEKLGDHFGIREDYISITEHWKNWEGNWILEIGLGPDEYDSAVFVEVDSSSKEILDDTDDKFLEDMKNLINSSSDEKTNLYISKIKNHTHYFTDKEIHNLLEASMKNGQIQRAATDKSIERFLLDLYQRNRIPLSTELDENLKKVLDDKNKMLDIEHLL